MPRPSKKALEEKAKLPVIAAPAPTLIAPPVMGGLPPQAPPLISQMGAPRLIDVESFLRVRDSAVGRLTAISELLRSFTNDYVRQTNLLLGEHGADAFQGDLFEAAAAQLIMPGADLVPAVEEKKERKKRTHDPNAPKRPLTPYFLYMQYARSIIANDLGAEAPKGAVQEEGQRRWANMKPDEKLAWNNAYKYNLRLYNARVHSYKDGNLNAKNMTDAEALEYANEFGIPVPEMNNPAETEAAGNVQDAIAEQLQQAASADDSTSKTPKKAAGSRKRKSEAPAAEADTSKVSAPPSSPDKKRRRSTKAPEDKEEPKKAAGRKKTKSS